MARRMMARAVADQARTEAFGAMGYLVLRFGNSDVLTNIDGVLDEIFHTLELRGV